MTPEERAELREWATTDAERWKVSFGDVIHLLDALDAAEAENERLRAVIGAVVDAYALADWQALAKALRGWAITLAAPDSVLCVGVAALDEGSGEPKCPTVAELTGIDPERTENPL